MHTVDIERIANLVSHDDFVRVQAANDLEQLETWYFDDHPLDRDYVQQQGDALLASYRATKSDLVRKWIFQVLLRTHVFCDGIDGEAIEALKPDCPYLPTVLGYVVSILGRLPAMDGKLAEFANHPDPKIRSHCALGFYSLGLTNSLFDPAANRVVRTLLLDEDRTARVYAALAMQTFKTLSETDRKLLERVVELNDGGASIYASQIIAKHFP